MSAKSHGALPGQSSVGVAQACLARTDMNSLLPCRTVWSALRFALHVVMATLPVASAFAADNAQSEQAFKAAADSFHDDFWERADSEFAAFVAKYSESAHVLEAVLLQAQSRFKLKRYDAVVDLLSSRVNTAGTQADQYHYWI